MLLGALLPLSRRYGLSREDLGLRATPAVRAVGLATLALVSYGVMAALWVVVVPADGSAELLGNVKHENMVNVVFAIFAVAVCGPVVEEVFFRGLLYRSLRNQLSGFSAVLVAGVLFGLVHIISYPLETLPVKATFGVIACLLYERTGSLLPGIGLHSFVNASAVDIIFTGNDLIVVTSALVLVATLLMGARYRTLLDGERPCV